MQSRMIPYRSIYYSYEGTHAGTEMPVTALAPAAKMVLRPKHLSPAAGVIQGDIESLAAEGSLERRIRIQFFLHSRESRNLGCIAEDGENGLVFQFS